jgi:IclR family transcriptional regulator, KDG regulon repressor
MAKVTESQNGTQRLALTLSKALNALNCFTETTSEWGAAELARELHSNLSTVHRLLITLEQFGYVERTPSGKFRLGLKMVNLGYLALSRSETYHFALPVVEDLASDLGLNATFAILYQGKAMYILRVEPEGARGHSPTGRLVPLHCTAIGKAMLMVPPDKEVERLVAGPLQRYTANTIVDPAEVIRQIAEARRVGYALDNNEFMANVRGVAIPVPNNGNDNPPAALAITGTAMKLTDDRIPEVVDRLFRGMGRLAFALGEGHQYS